MSFTITNLKKHLGPGLGLRKSKYLIEIPIPGIQGTALNILCRSAGLPERNISTVEAYHRGRKYKMKGETDYIGEYEISLVDDSDMSVRKIFDKWLTKIDNSKPKDEGVLGSSFEQATGAITDILDTASAIKNGLQDGGLSFFLGFLDKGNANSTSPYQTDVNIWQLDGNNNKVYGYKLQNCFPSSLGIVTLDDDDPNTLSEFSVVLSYSEFIPLYGDRGPLDQIARAIGGDGLSNVFDATKNF